MHVQIVAPEIKQENQMRSVVKLKKFDHWVQLRHEPRVYVNPPPNSSTQKSLKSLQECLSVTRAGEGKASSEGTSVDMYVPPQE